MNGFCKCPRPEPIPASRKDKKLAAQGKAHTVNFPSSCRYNGGVTYKGERYEGFEVPDPKVPKGWELYAMGVGLDLNAKPPLATMRLVPKG